MYDSKHRFQALSDEPADRPQKYQKGLREELLCNDCEQLLANNYEGYAAKSFYRPALEAAKQTQLGFTIAALDYSLFKLFLLSLLWRLGVTQVEEFRPAKLGPHLEELRKMVLNRDPGDWLKYPCMITALTLRGKFYGDFSAGAFSTKIEGISVWTFVLSGLSFAFFVGSHSPPKILHPSFLRPGGPLQIGVKDIREIDYLYEFCCGMGLAQRARH